MNIVRDNERIKQTGEVFTPTPLVNEILDKLPPEVFTDPTKTFCDPACGDGRFLVEVLKRKLAAGHSLHEASSTIYGVDLMADNVEACRENLRDILGVSSKDGELDDESNENIEKNIVCDDSLTWDFINWQKSTMQQQEDKIDDILGDY